MDLQSQIDKLKKEKEELERDKEKWQQEKQQLKTNNQQLQTDNETLLKGKATLQKEKESLQKETDSKIDLLQVQKDQLKKEKDAIEKELTKMKKEFESSDLNSAHNHTAEFWVEGISNNPKTKWQKVQKMNPKKCKKQISWRHAQERHGWHQKADPGEEDFDERQEQGRLYIARACGPIWQPRSC